MIYLAFYPSYDKVRVRECVYLQNKKHIERDMTQTVHNFFNQHAQQIYPV